MDERVGFYDLEMDETVTSTPFDNSIRRIPFNVSKEDKENAVGTRKGARKKWDLNPDLSVVFPPWTECDSNNFNCSEIIPSTSSKSSAIIVCKEDSTSPIEEEGKLRSKIPCNKITTGNHGPVNITNNVTFTKTNDKKDGRRSLQVVSKATAENKKKAQQRRSVDVRKAATKSTSVAGLPQRRLTLKKSTASVCQREPLPYACRNTLYDEHWSSKQERAFTKWLNYMLAPLDCYGNTLPTNGKKVDNTGQLQFRDEGSVNHIKVPISPFHSCRREARLRQSACLLYQSSLLEEVFLKLEVEVETRRLSMRLDQTIYSDVGLRQQLIELLNSYNTPWLRLGVEVLFGEILPMHTASGELVNFGAYCVKRLCENDDISRAYTCKIGTHGAGYEEALLQFAYRKLLMMVIFLDKAKMERLMDNDPCLFVKTANVKSSKQVLLALSDMFLCGEGDVVKHLRLLGYTLHHTQRPLDEYNYTVTTLATDLRDGIRLCRLTEMLTNNWELSRQLKVPAAGKTQKLHNVDAVLKMLRQHVNFPKLVTAQVIVQGHRELTLSLLWSIIFHFKVDLQLDLDELRKEIEQLKGQTQHPIARTNFCQRRASLEASIFFQSPSISLLLQWCQAICAIYGVTVTNFSTSFCDGRVFCYIIHHYHPALLPLESINNETSLTAIPPPAVEQDPATDDINDWTRSFSPTTNKEKTAILANEKANFKLLSEKMLLLGGVPPLVMSKDMVDTIPDEKVVITYTSYLCKQLLSISNEVRASIVIQRAWRRLHVKIELKKKLVKRDAAAVLIQAHVRRYLAQMSYHRTRRAVVVIQCHWRAQCKMLRQRAHYQLTRQAVLVIQCQFRVYRDIRRQRAAQVIQAYIRGYLQFRQYERLRHAACVIQLAYRKHLAVLKAEEERRRSAAVKIQSCWRRCVHRRSYLKLKHACIIVQRCYRARVLADEARNVFMAKKSAAIVIQSELRCFRARKMYLAQKNAIIVIQQWYRATLLTRIARAEYQKTVQCVRLIQLYVKKWFHRRLAAVIKLQANIRGYLERRRYIKIQEAAMTIQQHYRAHMLAVQSRQCYCQLKKSCIILQAAIRAWRRRQQYKQIQTAAVRIQSWYRGQIARQRYIRMRKACCVISCHWRAVMLGCAQRLAYLNLRCKVVRLQAVMRGWQCRKWVGLWHASAVVIQNAYRAHLSRRHEAVTKLQATFKAYHTRQLFLTLRQAARLIQVRYRALKEGRRLQEEYYRMRTSVIIIQAVYRGHLARKCYMQLKMAAITIQTNWRRHKQQTGYRVTREAILCIQRWYRWTHQSRLLHQRFLQLRHAAIIIQRGYVEYKKQKQHKAAVRIQSAVRCVLVRKKYLQMIRAAVTIQALTRGYLVRSHIRTLTGAVRMVQVRYKAKLVGRRMQKEYQCIRTSCIVLQSAFRGWKVRDYVVRLQAAVQTVEVAWLTRQQRIRYLCLKQSAVTIQKWYKSVLHTRQAHMQYLQIKSATIVLQSYARGLVARRLYRSHLAARKIQSYYRGYKARSQFLRMRSACVIIQSCIRRYCDRRNYLTLRAAALIIQSRIRALYHGRATRNEYLQLTNATIVIQATYKAIKQRYTFLDLKKKAVTIQAWYRMCVARKQYLAKRRAAVTLQAYMRSYLLTKAISNDYRMLREATVTVQSLIRAHQQRTKYLQLRQATVTIQATLRMYQCRKLYQNKMAAVLVLQKYTRSLLEGRRVRSTYVAMREAAIVIQSAYREHRTTRRNHAAITIQSHYRRYITQVRYNALRTAAVSIQRSWRGRQCRIHYQRLRQATLIIQSRIRALYHGRATRNEYLQLTNATVLIQAAYKAKKERRIFLKLTQATVTIQATLRMYQCRKLYQDKMAAVCVLQRHTRALLEGRRVRSAYVAMREAAIVIQLAYRKHRATRHNCAAVTIQSHYRQYIAQVRYRMLRAAAISMQRFWRGRQCRIHYQRLRQATLIIQSRIRALYHGRATRNEYLQLTNATVLIQATYKAIKQRRIFLELREKATTIQAWYRMFVARKQYLAKRRAAVTLQSYMRSYLLTKAISNDYRMLRGATVTVQSLIRAHQQRTKYLQLRQATVTIQATLRMCQCRKLYQDKMAAVLVLQRHTRALLEGRKVRCTYVSMREAAIVIQSAYRKHRATRHNYAAVTIQSHYRRYIAQVRYNALRTAAISIQRSWRGWQCCVHYNRLQKAALCLQRSYRAHALRVKIQEETERRIRAAILIQAAYRRHLCYTEFTRVRRAAVTLQAQFRRVRAQKEFNHIRSNVIFIQQKWRATLLATSVHADFEAKRKAVLIIQQHFRGYQRMKETRYQFVCLWAASVTLQRAFRQYLTYRQHQKQVAATCIQRAYRYYKRTVEIKRRVEFLKRFSHLVVMHLSAILIQRNWRCYQQRLLQQHRHLAAIKLQAWYKMIVVRQHYRKLLSSVNTVQQLCRNQIECIRQRKLHHGATIIQAHWRGYHVRCQMGSQIEEMRRRIKHASSEEHQRVTLRDQMPSLLQLLIKGKYLSHGSYVLEKLELITRLSDSCSLVLVQAGALPVLYDVINGTNRNRVSLLLVETTLQILLNLTRWSCTSANVLQHHDFVLTIVRLMQKVYVSQSDIMQQCCQLLSVYCKQEEVKSIQNHLGPEVKRLHSMSASLRDKLLILGKKWQHRTMTPLIQQQHQQLQRSLSSLERVLSASVISKYKY